MGALNVVLFLCILCTEYLLGGINFYTLNTLLQTMQNNFDEVEPTNTTLNESSLQSIERDYSALKQQAIVNLPNYGMLQGSIGFTAWTNRPILQFLNVPYAESPSGYYRFKAPVPIKRWAGIHNAEEFGKKCPVLEDLDKLSQDDKEKEDLEDCLNMAIYSTNLNGSLPVMVYIHGGGFYLHNAEEFPPNYLMERNIVLVVVQYRLDALGFLSTNTEEIPGNAGLMDSIQALRFIKENIKYFGGNADRITIFGQSSGAAMVSALIISPNIPEDLFHGAIIQSGSIFKNWAYTTDPVADARDIAKAAGLDRNQSLAMLNRAFMTMSVYDLLKAVELSQMNILETGVSQVSGRSLSIGGPNNLLPDLPQNLIRSGKYNKSIPIMAGTTKHDGSWIAAVLYDILAATNKLTDKKFMTYDLIETMCRMLRVDDDGGVFQALASHTYWTSEQISSGQFKIMAPGIIDLLGIIAFKAPVLQLVQMNARVNPLQTYLYTFDYKGQYTRYGYGANVSHYPFSGGVHHSDDLMYLFPYPPNVAKLNEEDTKMSQVIVDLWTSFATTGIPALTPITESQTNGDNAIQKSIWQPFSDPFGPYLHIDKELRLGLDYRNEF